MRIEDVEDEWMREKGQTRLVRLAGLIRDVSSAFSYDTHKFAMYKLS